jgi:hypothetical protein
MATVFLAEDLKHKRKVALKVSGPGEMAGVLRRSVGARRWSPSDEFLFFWSNLGPREALFRARVERTPNVVVRPAESLLVKNLASASAWDLHPDGRSVVVAALPDAPAEARAAGAPAQESRYLVVLHWFTELKAMMAQEGRR